MLNSDILTDLNATIGMDPSVIEVTAKLDRIDQVELRCRPGV